MTCAAHRRARSGASAPCLSARLGYRADKTRASRVVRAAAGGTHGSRVTDKGLGIVVSGSGGARCRSGLLAAGGALLRSGASSPETRASQGPEMHRGVGQRLDGAFPSERHATPQRPQGHPFITRPGPDLFILGRLRAVERQNWRHPCRIFVVRRAGWK